MRAGWWILGLCVAGPLDAQDPTVRVPSLFERVGRLARDGPVRESSGVAVSRRFPGILWTHNDSGDGPNLYAIRPDGELVATFRVQGARQVDWEDLALGPCPDSPERACLYIGDLGDNEERRTRGILYIVPEPDPLTMPRDSVVPARAVRVRYTDGAHDVEAVAVDPAGTVHLVTKGRSGGILRFAIPREALLDDSVVAAPAQTLPITPRRLAGRWVTGAAISLTSGRIVVRTYTEIRFFHPSPTGWVPDGPPCWLGFVEPFGEAVDFLDEDTLVLTSETLPGTDGTITRVRC